MMLWGDDTEFKTLENQNKICSAMTDDEKSGEARLTGTAKQEIAEICQLSKADVCDVLAKHDQFVGFHGFLKARRAKNEPMPESREDLMMIYKLERPDFLMAKPSKRSRPSPKRAAAMRYRKHS